MKKAFTLLELIIVITIIGLLSSITIPTFSKITQDAKVANVRGNLANLRSAIGMYIAKTDEIPNLIDFKDLENVTNNSYSFTDFYSKNILPITPSSSSTNKSNNIIDKETIKVVGYMTLIEVIFLLI